MGWRARTTTPASTRCAGGSRRPGSARGTTTARQSRWPVPSERSSPPQPTGQNAHQHVPCAFSQKPPDAGFPAKGHPAMRTGRASDRLYPSEGHSLVFRSPGPRGGRSDAHPALATGRHLGAPRGSPCGQLWRSAAECRGGRAGAAGAARVPRSGFSQAHWESRLWQLTRETNGSQKSLPGTLAMSRGQLALPQPACHPFYGYNRTRSGNRFPQRSQHTLGFGEQVQGLKEHDYLYAMLHISGLLRISSRSLPDCSATR